jgi:hypothetical protein
MILLALNKLLLLPLGIAGFVLMLLLFGAFGLLVAMAVITAATRLWSLLFRRGRARPAKSADRSV